MANQYGFSLGEAMRDGQAIKSNRTQNALSSLKLQDAQRMEEERPAREAQEAERLNTLSDVRGKASTGDTDAQRKLLSIDPEGAPSFIEALEKMDEAERNKVKSNIEETGKMSFFILNGETDEEKERRFQMVKQSLPESAASTLPANFDQAVIELTLAKATAIDKMMEAPKAVEMGDTGEVWQGGQRRNVFSTGKAEDRAIKEAENKNKAEQIASDERVAKGKRSENGGGRELKISDEKGISSMVAQLYGGMYNPSTGEFSLTDKTILPEVLAVVSRAAGLWRDDPNNTMSAAEAIEKVGAEYGIEFPMPVNSQPQAKPKAQPQYKEGQRAKDASGNVIIFQNGKWSPTN